MDNTETNEYVSRAEFDKLRNQLINSLEIINEILNGHVNVDSFGIHKLAELESSVREIQEDLFN